MSFRNMKQQLVAAVMSVAIFAGGGIALLTSAPSVLAADAAKGSIMLDTAQYVMAPGNQYTIGAFIQNPNGRQLTPTEKQQFVSQGKLRVRDSRTGSIVNLEQLSTGHFRVTAKNTGTCYILYEIGGTHASVRIDVQNGVQQHGTAVRNTSFFVQEVFQTISKSEESEQMLNIQIGEHRLTATLEKNSSAQALVQMLSQGPVTINMSDYANMEKVGILPRTLPKNDAPIRTQAGDLILYQGNSFVIYYDVNSWSLTRLGKINNITQQELKNILADGNVTVVLSLD